MAYPSQFENIRPYTEEELPGALQRLAAAPNFADVAAFLYPGQDADAVRRRILGLRSIYDFQHTVMLSAFNQIVDRTIDNFTYSGAENLTPDIPSLYISNHRDIALDALLLQVILDKENCPTSQVTFGANLMKHPLVVEAGRINKMFRVERGGTPKQFYQSLMQMSQYIRYVVTERHESVWIAQRNGRTKDGIDRTEPSLIKMLAQSHNSQFTIHHSSNHTIKQSSNQQLPILNSQFSPLHIVPIAVSYEYEPCDALKARELALSMKGQYHKSENEDLNSILTGILQPKGHVHFSICKPITEEDLNAYKPEFGDPYKWLASLLDQRILGAYHLMPTNYIAHDLIENGTQAACLRYSNQQFTIHNSLCRAVSPRGHHNSQFKIQNSKLIYTPQQRQAFIDRMNSFNLTPEQQKIFLDIYANPVRCKM